MGLFDFLKSDRRFVSEAKYNEGLAKQENNNKMVLDQLYKMNVSEDRELSLEFFFYTNDEKKAVNLGDKLKEAGYKITYVQRAESDKRLWVVNGWSLKMKMNLPTVTGWSKLMCNIGYETDCDFDGWGTTPEQ